MDPRLRLLEKIKLELTGHVYIGDQKVEGWKKPISYYMFKCPIHGYVCNHVTGHDEKLLCPICLEDESKKLRSQLTTNL